MRMEYVNSGSLECDADLHYCGYEDTPADFFCGPNVRDCYLVHYILRGGGFYTFRGKTYTLKPGDAFLIYPKEVVYYFGDREVPLSFYWFSYNGRKAPEFTLRMGFTEALPVLHLEDDNCIPQRMDSLLEAYTHSGQPREFTLLSHLYSLFLELERSAISVEQKPTPQKSAYVYIDKALQFIACNYHRDIKVEEISRYVGLERTYFSKLFGRITGSPPQQYLLQFRLEKSLPLLRETSLSIGEIGRGVGLENAYYFSRAFKKRMGASPSGYRKSSGSITAE